MDQQQQAALLGRLGLTRKVCEAKGGWGAGVLMSALTKGHLTAEGHLVSGAPRPQARLTLSWKAVMSHSSTSRLEPRFSAAMNCSKFSCFMPGVLKISRSLCHDCLS